MERKPHNTRKILALILALALALSLTGIPASARTLKDIQDDISDTQNQRNSADQQQKTVAQQLAEAESRLHTLEQDIAVLQDQLTVVESTLATAEQDLIRLQAELTVTEEHLDQQTSVLDTRLSSIYKQGDMGYVEVILGATDFDDFINRITYLQMVVKSDKKVLDEITTTKDEVEEDRDRAAAKKEEIDNKVSAIKNIKTPLDIKQQQIVAEKEYKQSLYAQLATDIASKDQILKDLIAEQQAAAGRSVGGGERPGYFGVWPAGNAAWVTSYYGYRTHPIYGDIRFHYGLDIGVDEGTPVLAPAAGTVIYIGWNDAVGNTVEIDHGGGVKTRYCHLLTNGISVSEGEHLAMGQRFALSGNTGYSSTGGHLHFEVFDYQLSNNEYVPPYNTYQRAYTVDPLGWLP
ncbi:MAG: peptidoglycan DD-metalloendopeptidase family protein [Actinomycetota bacterium]